MRLTREQTALTLSAPLMIAGLAAAALAPTWLVRAGGAAMVIGGAVALGVTSARLRKGAWIVGLIGLAAVLMGLV